MTMTIQQLEKLELAFRGAKMREFAGVIWRMTLGRYLEELFNSFGEFEGDIYILQSELDFLSTFLASKNSADILFRASKNLDVIGTRKDDRNFNVVVPAGTTLKLSGLKARQERFNGVDTICLYAVIQYKDVEIPLSMDKYRAAIEKGILESLSNAVAPVKNNFDKYERAGEWG